MRHLPTAAAFLLCAAALLGLRALPAVERQVIAAPPMCSGEAASPRLLEHVTAERIVFLTRAAEPLRSEQFFCLQRRLLPRAVRRAPLDDDGRHPLGFAPGVAALAFAGDDEPLAAIRERLAAEAAPAPVQLLGREGGWAWLEARAP